MGYRDVVLADRPVIYWPLDQRNAVDGTIQLDHSGNNRHATCSGLGASTNGQGLIPGDRASFGGGDGVAGAAARTSENAPNPGTGDYALEVWVQSNYNDAGYGALADLDPGATGDGILIYTKITNGQLHLWSAGANISTTTAPEVTNGRPHHIVLTRVAGVAYGLIDGKIYGSVASTGTTTPATIGVRRTGTTAIGSVSHLAYYLRGLTERDCLRHYQAGMNLQRRSRTRLTL